MAAAAAAVVPNALNPNREVGVRVAEVDTKVVVGVGAHREGVVAAAAAAVAVDPLHSSSMVGLPNITKEGVGEGRPSKEVVEGTEAAVALLV